MEDRFPIVNRELLEKLDELFPEKCPDPSWTDREIWMKAGERRVVRLLKSHFEQQNNNVLENPLVLGT